MISPSFHMLCQQVIFAFESWASKIVCFKMMHLYSGVFWFHINKKLLTFHVICWDIINKHTILNISLLLFFLFLKPFSKTYAWLCSTDLFFLTALNLNPPSDASMLTSTCSLLCWFYRPNIFLFRWVDLKVIRSFHRLSMDATCLPMLA